MIKSVRKVIRWMSANAISSRLALALGGTGLGIGLDRFSYLDIGVATMTLVLISVLTLAVLFQGSNHAQTLETGLDDVKSKAIKDAADTKAKLDVLAAQTVVLVERFGLSIDVQSTEELNLSSQPNRDDRIAAIVRGAKSSVRMLDLIEAPGHRADALIMDDVRGAYFEDLNELVRRPDPAFNYRRIVQTRQVDAPLKGISDLHFLQHARQMAVKQADKTPGIVLRSTPVVFPYKFILIDSYIVVLQLQRQGDEALALDCEVVIVDPARRIVGVFERMWQEVEDHTNARVIQISEIDEAISKLKPTKKR